MKYDLVPHSPPCGSRKDKTDPKKEEKTKFYVLNSRMFSVELEA
jgi:hypothetical protein